MSGKYWPEPDFMVHHLRPDDRRDGPPLTAFIQLPYHDRDAYQIACCVAVLRVLGPALGLCVHELDGPVMERYP